MIFRGVELARDCEALTMAPAARLELQPGGQDSANPYQPQVCVCVCVILIDELSKE